jgi:hypothetical protein
MGEVSKTRNKDLKGRTDHGDTERAGREDDMLEIQASTTQSGPTPWPNLQICLTTQPKVRSLS